jgi:hypothetical protein
MSKIINVNQVVYAKTVFTIDIQIKDTNDRYF